MAAVMLLTGIWMLMTRTRFGLLMRATQLDRETAQAFGIPVGKVYAAVFGLGAALAALAGVLIVPIQQAHYLMGHDPLLLSFIVVIIGGLGSLPGTVVAALLIGNGADPTAEDAEGMLPIEYCSWVSTREVDAVRHANRNARATVC